MMLRSVSVYLFFVALLLELPVFAISMDWSGFARSELYFQNEDYRTYGVYDLTLKPRIQVLDGLNIASRVRLHNLESLEIMEDQQVSHIFFYQNSDKEFLKEAVSSFLKFSQIYISYEGEFFRFLFGRAPQSFGRGLTYDSGDSPFDIWFDSIDQVALRLSYKNFYVEPKVFYLQDQFVAFLQGGFHQGSLKLEAFYQKGSTDFIEGFASYQFQGWSASFSFNYLVQKDLSLGIVGDIEKEVDLNNNKVAFGLELGWAPKDRAFHKNYNPALFLWNQIPSQENNSKFLVEPGAVQDVIYGIPQVEFQVFEDFNIGVDCILSWSQEYDFQGELDFSANYTVEEDLHLRLQGGVLPESQDRIVFGLLVQAAVTF